MSEIEVRVYRRPDGRKPFDEWLESLTDVVAKARVLTRVARVQSESVGDCGSVGAGVLELRIHRGPGYRVYFGRHGHTLVLLLCGGDKRSQARDILAARSYWNDWKTQNR